jgi:tellurite resistance protein TehA-like permease
MIITNCSWTTTNTLQIGPCGQLSTAFQLLGQSASGFMRFAEYKPSAVHPPMYGTFWRAETAQGLNGAGILFSLLLLGFDYLCLCIAIIGVLDHVFKRQATYSLTWWSLIFPTVTLTSAWLQLGSAMDSPTFRGLTTALTVILCIFYFGNWGFTIWGLAKGSLVFGQSQVEIEDGLMKKAQDEKRKTEV